MSFLYDHLVLGDGVSDRTEYTKEEWAKLNPNEQDDRRFYDVCRATQKGEIEMSDPIVPTIIQKYLADREVIKEMKKRHAEELRTIEEFQAKREAALLERAGIEAFEFFTDLFVNGRDGKAATEKAKESIAMNQTKIESWLLKMLNSVGEGIKTSAGTVYKTRKESVTCQDFEMFVDQNMLKDAAVKIAERISDTGVANEEHVAEFIQIIHNNMHLELLTKAVRKEAILELMGEPAKDGSRPNTPPAGVNYVAVQCVGVRKAK